MRPSEEIQAIPFFRPQKVYANLRKLSLRNLRNFCKQIYATVWEIRFFSMYITIKYNHVLPLSPRLVPIAPHLKSLTLLYLILAHKILLSAIEQEHINMPG